MTINSSVIIPNTIFIIRRRYYGIHDHYYHHVINLLMFRLPLPSVRTLRLHSHIPSEVSLFLCKIG